MVWPSCLFSKPICLKLDKEFSLGLAYQPSILINNRISTNNLNDDNCPQILSTKAMPNSFNPSRSHVGLTHTQAGTVTPQTEASLPMVTSSPWHIDSLLVAIYIMLWNEGTWNSFHFLFLWLSLSLSLFLPCLMLSLILSQLSFFNFSLSWSDSNYFPKL